MSWARLMRRVFELEVLVCPRCAAAMQRIAFVTASEKIAEMLDSIGFAADSPASIAA